MNMYFEETATPLGASQTFTGADRYVGRESGAAVPFATFCATVSADASGTCYIEQSNDGVVWRRATSTASFSATSPVAMAVPITARMYRVIVINGSTAQGALLVCTSLCETSPIPLNTAIAVGGTLTNNDNTWYQESVTAQAANATLTGSSRDTGAASGANMRYSAFNVLTFADQAGTVRIEVSNDNASWRRATADNVVAAGSPVILSIPIVARYQRAVFVNGATAQATFLLNTSFTAA